jgi:hypothetical protein
MAVGPPSRSLLRGRSTTYAVTLTRTGGFASAVTLRAAGLPAGMTAAFSPNPAPGSTSTLAVRTRTWAKPGTYRLTVRGTAGAVTRFASVTLVVRRA